MCDVVNLFLYLYIVRYMLYNVRVIILLGELMLFSDHF